MKFIHNIGAFLSVWAMIFSAHAQVKPAKGFDLGEAARNYKKVTLKPNLSALNPQEIEALGYLLKAAKAADEIFWLQAFGPKKDQFLNSIQNDTLRLYAQINYGPWDRLNGNAPFLDGYKPKPLGANFYPADMTKGEFDSCVLAKKEDPYSIIERINGKLETTSYSSVYRDQLKVMLENMKLAADLYRLIYPPMHAYLIRRMNGLTSGMYMESDVIWLTLRDNNIDVIIGPIENYEDQLNGIRNAFESYILLRDKEWGKKLEKYTTMLPELQSQLPVAAKYKPQLSGNAGSSLVVADAIYYAGDCNAGSKTMAVNLPNDEEIKNTQGTRRTQIRNVMKAKFENIVVPISKELIDESQVSQINFDAFFNNVMFHEVAHGLGIHNLADGTGKTVKAALSEAYSAIEECKADVLGLWLVGNLVEKKELPGTLEQYYVNYVASIFRSVRFGASSAHGKANMIAFNKLLNAGAIIKNSSGKYKIIVDKMKIAINNLAAELLQLQGDGEYAMSKKFIEENATVSGELQLDLKKLISAGIAKDIYFEQGAEVLGLKN